jgi:pyruvate dehydrogenase E2 component (dihydrolipoamide acetyltransferase)
MAEILRLPRMSDTMEEGVFADIFIKVGDTISSGQVIAEVETDKASMEWESFQEGTVLYLGVEKGDSVPVNALVAIIGEKGEDYESLLNSEANASNKTEKPASQKEDKEKDTDEENDDEEEKSFETAKETDDDNTIEFDIAGESGENQRVKASPLAKKIAEDKGIDLSKVQGSGDDGRIVRKDIENYKPQTQATEQPKESPKAEAKAPELKLPQIVAEESYEEVKVSQMRKIIAKRLSESKFQAPHFYLTMEVNMNNAMEARKAINEVAPVKISFNDLVIKATAQAIRKHPEVNASWLGENIRYNHHIHIGMAVAVDEGLVVPVIKFADNKSLSHIATEAKNFAEKAKNKKLTPDEMQGNTFSISNLGMMGISEFTAVINPPDACILAVGAIKKELALQDGELIENNIMRLTLSCDHRVVDGAVGSKFLNTLKQNLENPVMMLV